MSINYIIITFGAINISPLKCYFLRDRQNNRSDVIINYSGIIIILQSEIRDGCKGYIRISK